MQVTLNVATSSEFQLASTESRTCPRGGKHHFLSEVDGCSAKTDGIRLTCSVFLDSHV